MISSKRNALRLAALACTLLVAAAPVTSSAEFGKLVKVAGDRQIVVGPFNMPKAPFTVRVYDASAAPLGGVPIHIQGTITTDPQCAGNWDEFHFAGFNAPFSLEVCERNGAAFGVTAQDGLITLTPGDSNPVPSAFLIGAAASVGTQQGVPDIARIQFFSIVRAVNPPAGQPQVVVEYFHDGYRNYFNTIDQIEIDALDAGLFSGWTREVGSVIAWPTQAAAPPGTVSVCRFFASKFTSHFYTADPVECDAVVANFPDWLLETREAYWIHLPDKSTGACAENLMPVYRVFKPTSPNHRYVTDRVVRDTMVAAGWIAEGYGPDAVIMCTPR
jgi:hypothetical protein